MADNDDPPTTGPTTTRSRARGARASPSTGDRSAQQPVYGYHQTFHTHLVVADAGPAPSYAVANSANTLRRLREREAAERAPCELPRYSCTVELQGTLGWKQELSTPFQMASNRDWHDVYVVLRGTQLCLHHLKYSSNPFSSKNRDPKPGRIIKRYTLQHAEVGIAADFRKTGPTPKSPFAHLVPVAARQKLFETDPHLFDPVREHVIRLRLEGEQLLLCASTPEDMLDWVEHLTAAVDISPPLEDRTEPRYRSLPRRSRRQRMLDTGMRLADLDNLLSNEGGRSIVAEQEQILRHLYPHLAGPSSDAEEQSPALAAHSAHSAADPETDDLDPDDVRFPAVRPTPSRNGEFEDSPSSLPATESLLDPKSHPPHIPSHSQTLRYRRRCAPILLANSPRVSDVLFCAGARMRINIKEHMLVPFTPLPPRYDAHHLSKKRGVLPCVSEAPHAKHLPAPISTARPAAPVRGVSNDSFLSFGYELASASSHQNMSGSEHDHVHSAFVSEPPSPTAATHTKADAARQLVVMGKVRTSEDRPQEDNMNAAALGVGLLI